MTLEGKKLLITGVINRESIAFEVAKQAQAAGAEIVLTGFGRAKRMTERSATPAGPGAGRARARRQQARGHRGRRGGPAASAGAASTASCTRSPSRPRTRWAGNFLNTPVESAVTAFTTSAFSLKALTVGLSDLFPEEGASIVGLDFDAQVAWPVYDWMGVAKAALEATARYLARDLGPRRVRVNLVSAGPLATLAARGIPGFARPRRSPGRSRRRCRGTSRIRRRSRRRSTSCSATPRGRSPPRSSTSTAASTRWARRSCPLREEVEA